MKNAEDARRNYGKRSESLKWPTKELRSSGGTRGAQGNLPRFARSGNRRGARIRFLQLRAPRRLHGFQSSLFAARRCVSRSLQKASSFAAANGSVVIRFWQSSLHHQENKPSSIVKLEFIHVAWQ